MFNRTNSGLSNIAIFHGVDFLVYSEGGENNPEEGANNWSIDSIFWQSIFKKFLPNTKVKIKSLGSKSTLTPIAKKILSGEISKSIAVFDRDYDSLKGIKLSHPNIIYSYGYSWENDACRVEFLISSLNSIHNHGKIPQHYIDDIKTRYEIFLKSINRLVYIDLLCSLGGIQGVDRKRYWALIDTTDSKDLKLKKDQFLNLIKDIKSRRTTSLHYHSNERICPANDCYGKIIAHFCYYIYCEYFKKITNIKNINHAMVNLAIAKSPQETEIDDYPAVIKEHYNKVINNIKA